MNYLEFDDLSYQQLQLFVEKGNTDHMPAELVKYLSLLELIRGLYDKYKSKSFIVKLLAKPPYNLSEYHVNKLYADSLNFFYADNQIKAEAWSNIYADRFDKLALLCIAANDFEGAKKNYEIAARYRIKEDKTQIIPPELRDRRPIFFTMKPREAGFPDVNKRKLAQFCDSLPDIPHDVRLRLHRDGMTEQSEGNLLGVDTQDIDFIDVK